ncbi:MAG: DUF1844 domain-containing protein [Deltaproteobacteria bacterium]|nr:DUF1844 domain-containing protein [Deltaproteobacteria bacterium]
MDNKDFKVVDKRRFSETGERKAEEKKEVGTDQQSKETEDTSKSAPLPPVDFSTFILSLSTSAMLYLGEIPNLQTNKSEKNLELARHTIDMIDMLKQKTKGNLTEVEARFVENVLYDLRMTYVNVSK